MSVDDEPLEVMVMLVALAFNGRSRLEESRTSHARRLPITSA